MMKKKVVVRREISLSIDEIIEHLDDDFKEVLKTALLSRSLSGIVCYSKFSNVIDLSLEHNEFVCDIEGCKNV